jgi:hypothetical protein
MNIFTSCSIRVGECSLTCFSTNSAPSVSEAASSGSFLRSYLHLFSWPPGSHRQHKLRSISNMCCCRREESLGHCASSLLSCRIRASTGAVLLGGRASLEIGLDQEHTFLRLSFSPFHVRFHAQFSRDSPSVCYTLFKEVSANRSCDAVLQYLGFLRRS